MASSKRQPRQSDSAGGHPADGHNLIRVQGARVNNLNNCRATANANQRDTDGDGIGDACDAQIGPPATKDQCKNDNWTFFNSPVFKNQGACVSSVASKNK